MEPIGHIQAGEDCFNVDYENVKQNIFLELVNYEQSKEQLELLPHNRILDLTIRYRILTKKEEEIGITSFIISNDLLHLWEVTKQTLHEVALSNTERIFPPKIIDMDKALFQYVIGALNPTDKEDIYQKFGGTSIWNKIDTADIKRFLITNNFGPYGADTILYPGFLKQTIKQYRLERHNIYLLPSSVNEIVLFASRQTVPMRTLLRMIKNLNHNVIEPIYQLSDAIYRYDYQEDVITFYQGEGIN